MVKNGELQKSKKLSLYKIFLDSTSSRLIASSWSFIDPWISPVTSLTLPLLLKAAESFAINIPTLSLLHYVAYLGNYSGEQMDKISFLQLETFTPITITAPLLQSCCAWVEMEVHDIKKIGNHELIIAYPKKILVDPKSFDQNWQLGSVDSRPLIYLDNQRYSVFGQSYEAKLPTKAENHYKILAETTKEHLSKISEENEKLVEKMDQIKREVGTDLISEMSAAIINEELNQEK